MAVCLFPRVRKMFYWVGSGLLAVTIAGVATTPTLAQEGEAPASEVRRVDQVSGSDFSVSYAEQLTTDASQAITSGDFTTAISKLTEARELYNELSTYYKELAEMFFGIDTRQNRSNRDLALETAQKRDEVTYQLALVHRSQDAPEEAVPLFMEVLRSQQPTRELGNQAYDQLFEMGFVEAPYEP